MASVTYRIKGEYDGKAANQAQSGLNGLADKVNSLTGKLKQSSAPLTNLTKAFSNLGKAAPGLFVVKTAFNAINKTIGACVKSMQEMEAEWVNVEKGLTRIDIASGLNVALNDSKTSLKKFASDLNSTLGGYFGYDEIMNAMSASGIIFDKTEKQIKQITKTAADLSAALGIDLTSAMQQVSATLNGETGRLGKYFSELKGLTKEQLKAGEGINVITSKINGTAEKLKNTTEASLKAAKDASATLKSELGAIFTNALTPVRNFFTAIKNGWADALKKQREYREAEEARRNGTADSGNYESLIIKKEAEVEAARIRTTDEYISSMTNRSGGRFRYSERQKQADLDNYNRLMAELDQLRKERAEVEARAERERLEAERAQRDADARAERAQRQSIFTDYFGKNGIAVSVDLSNIPEYGPIENPNPEIEETTKTQKKYIESLLTSIKSVFELSETFFKMNKIINPLETIFQALIDELDPFISGVLNPFVEYLSFIGKALAQSIIPMLKEFQPVLDGILKGLTWMYNYILRPLIMGVVAVFVTLENAVIGIANGFISIANIFKKQNPYSTIEYKSYDAVKDIPELSYEGLKSTIEASAISGETATTTASYTAARDIYLNVYYEHSFVNGDAREIALQIRDEIRSAERLGA